MKKDAEMHAAEDAQKKELAEAKNLAEQMIYTAEKALKDAEGKIGDDIKTSINGKTMKFCCSHCANEYKSK